MEKNKAAQELGKLSAEARDTSSEAMRALVQKRWDKEKIFTNKKGQKIGWVKDGIFRKKVSKRKHLMKIFDAWGIDKDVLTEVNEIAGEIRILDNDENKVYSTTPTTYFAHGITKNFETEQVFLPRKHFSVKEI